MTNFTRGYSPDSLKSRYRWKAIYADVEISDVCKLKALESGIARLNGMQGKRGGP